MCAHTHTHGGGTRKKSHGACYSHHMSRDLASILAPIIPYNMGSYSD